MSILILKRYKFLVPSFMATLFIKNQGQALCVALFLVLVLAFCSSPAFCARQLYGEDRIMMARHEEWMAKHGRVYKDAEEKERRYNIFKSKVEFIEAFNKKKDQKYTLGINKFSDLTHEEFLAMHSSGFKMGQRQASMSNVFRYENLTDLPSEVDWRQAGIVTPAKQQTCGNCWAFSSIAAVEGISALKTGKLISLSEQQLMDCDTGGSEHGCHGGGLQTSFKYMIDSKKSLASEDDYPYTGIEGSICKPVAPAAGAIAITGYEDVPKNDENSLMKAVANQPVSVGFDPSGLQNYSGGVYTGPCGTNLTHAVTIVGYGFSVQGKYWIVKNSWGTEWAENGFIKVQRDVPAKEGLCGIAIVATYPTA